MGAYSRKEALRKVAFGSKSQKYPVIQDHFDLCDTILQVVHIVSVSLVMRHLSPLERCVRQGTGHT